MKLNTPEKKHQSLIPLSLLFLLLLGAGIYSLIKPKGNIFSSYSVNKYPDTVNWCVTSVNEEILIVDCKALLINIGTDNCFDVQIITKDKDLKDLIVCESGDALAYTNDVLGYKKLMPVDMVFTYTKEGILNDYSFTSVSFDKVNDTYVQGIVNEDIANLVTIDPSTTTIQNSVDFCPRPEVLPGYVTEANKKVYTEYFNKNILTKEEYENPGLFNLQDSEIFSLFTCESQANLLYISGCSKLNFLNADLTNLALSLNPLPPQFDKILDIFDYTKLKQISYLYDNTDYILPSYQPFSNDENIPLISVNRLEILRLFVEDLNTLGNTSEEVYCGMYNIIDRGLENTDKIDIYQYKMKQHLENNISQVHSTLCLSIISKNLSPQGAYLKGRFSKPLPTLELYNRCSNLQKQTK